MLGLNFVHDSAMLVASFSMAPGARLNVYKLCTVIELPERVL